MGAVPSPINATLLEQLRQVLPLQGHSAERLDWLAGQGQRQRIELGHILLAHGDQPAGLWLLLAGQLRSLGEAPGQARPRTLEKHEPGALVGWISLLHHAPLEHLRASTACELLFLPHHDATQLLREPTLQAWCAEQLPAAELWALLLSLSQQERRWQHALNDWPQLAAAAQLAEASSAEQLNPQLLWYRSQPESNRWIGLPPPSSSAITPAAPAELLPPPAPAATSSPPIEITLDPAAGPREIPLAICLAIARFFGVPANRDALLDQIDAILQRQPQLNLINLGQLLSSLDLRVMLSEVPPHQLGRVPAPAVLLHQGRFGVLDGVDPDGQARLLEAELGPIRIPRQALLAPDADQLELLLIEPRPGGKQARFSWSWYAPYLKPHLRELLEVLAASAVVNTLALVTPLGLQVLIDQVSRSSAGLSALISISFLLLVAALVGAISRGLRSLIFTNVANRIDQATKSSILDQLVRLPQGFFDSRPVGQITFYFSQLDRLREFLIGQSLTTVVDFGFSLLYVAVLLWINPLLTLVTLSTLPLFAILALVSNPLVEKLIERSIGQAIRTYSYLTEAITGIQTIKSQNAELKTRWEFQNRYASFIGEDFKLRVTSETVGSLATFINDLNGLLVIGFGIYLVMQAKITLGAFIAFRIISGYITGPLVKLVQTYQQFKISTEQLRMVGDVVDRRTEQSDDEAQNIPMAPIEGHVQVRNVSFRFSEDAPRVLHNVSLEIPAGCFVGMVGGSGSGKSTILKLLPRFYKPEKGSVLIDGYDINKVELYSLRRQIGVVPQDSLLFDGTIKDNLLLVKPDATADEMIRAAKIACAHDFIMELSQGYNSSVGERGAGLSGGQRQRMALARAVLQNPRMLILDEATSALDARTERQVCLNLFEAFRGRTVFFITHRLSTVRPADQIVLMDRGAIMEVGSHSELIERRGWYYALYQSQNQEGQS